MNKFMFMSCVCVVWVCVYVCVFDAFVCVLCVCVAFVG